MGRFFIAVLLSVTCAQGGAEVEHQSKKKVTPSGAAPAGKSNRFTFCMPQAGEVKCSGGTNTVATLSCGDDWIPDKYPNVTVTEDSVLDESGKAMPCSVTTVRAENRSPFDALAKKSSRPPLGF